MSRQTAGTAPVTVGRSISIMCTSGAAWRNRSGMIIEAPTRNAAYGSPQLITWNIGTTARRLSRSVKPNASAMHTCMECR
jgi:hypothetical protein